MAAAFSGSGFPWTDLRNNISAVCIWPWVEEKLEVQRWEKREIQIFFWASENSWLQSYTHCKTTTLWPESLRDAFYAIRFYSNRDERPFMLNFAIECSSWIEKHSCIDHLSLKDRVTLLLEMITGMGVRCIGIVFIRESYFQYAWND